MTDRTITLDEAAQASLALLSRGYGDGLLNDWASRGAPSDGRQVGDKMQRAVKR